MVLRLDDYQNYQELLEKIHRINELYYEPAARNIISLQKHSEKMIAIYAVALRDSYSHLVKIFEYEDILEAENKTRIVRQLERYLGHLEALLYDTFLKIIKIKSDELFVRLRKGDQPKVKNQLAVQVQKARMVDDKIAIGQKIDGFEKIISFIEDIYTTHQF